MLLDFLAFLQCFAHFLENIIGNVAVGTKTSSLAAGLHDKECSAEVPEMFLMFLKCYGVNTCKNIYKDTFMEPKNTYIYNVQKTYL